MKKVLLMIIVSFIISCGAKHKNTTKELKSINDSIILIGEPPQPDFGVIEEISHEVMEEVVVSSEVSSEVYHSVNENFILEESRSLEINGNINSGVNVITEPTIVQGYKMGKFVYHIPDEMIKLGTYVVTAKISKDLVDLSIYDGMEVTVDTIIRVSDLMQVELVDPSGDNFKIISQSSTQFIEMSEPTTWVFFVTPLKYGEAKLSVIVSVIKDGNLKQTVYNDDVIVKTTTWLEVKLWFSNYWQWFTVVLLIPIIRWIQGKFNKNKKE